MSPRSKATAAPAPAPATLPTGLCQWPAGVGVGRFPWSWLAGPPPEVREIRAEGAFGRPGAIERREVRRTGDLELAAADPATGARALALLAAGLPVPDLLAAKRQLAESGSRWGFLRPGDDTAPPGLPWRVVDLAPGRATPRLCTRTGELAAALALALEAEEPERTGQPASGWRVFISADQAEALPGVGRGIGDGLRATKGGAALAELPPRAWEDFAAWPALAREPASAKGHR